MPHSTSIFRPSAYGSKSLSVRSDRGSRSRTAMTYPMSAEVARATGHLRKSSMLKSMTTTSISSLSWTSGNGVAIKSLRDGQLDLPSVWQIEDGRLLPFMGDCKSVSLGFSFVFVACSPGICSMSSPLPGHRSPVT